MTAELSPPPPALWARAAQALALDEPAQPRAAAVPIGRRRRRGYDAQADDGRAQVRLVRSDEGLLRWVYTAPRAGRGGAYRAYRSLSAGPGDVVQGFRFADFGANEITQRLVALDAWFMERPGLCRWEEGGFVATPPPQIDRGRVLLLVHGTFSGSRMWAHELGATAAGVALQAAWRRRYSALLGFEHPTLSVGAWSNAIDLQRALGGVRAPIDIVCHSRGGLVVAWLLRLAALPVERVVFVGVPLVGTSLAAPDKLRAALDLLANYADVAARVSDAATTVFPLAAGVAGLAKILGGVLRLGSGLPLVDAAIALVPGLATQQAVANNLELRQLFADTWRVQPQMSALGVSFQPDESRQPLWKFWKRFTGLGDQLKYAGADLVFPGPSDLIVDLRSMNQLGEGATIELDDLGVSAHTHHTNYFRDARVLECLAARLR